MDSAARLDTPLGRTALIAAAVLAAVTVLSSRPRLRGLAMMAALVLTPVLLVAEIYDTEQFQVLRDRPAFTAAAVAVALGAVCALAVLIARNPAALVLLAVGALPFRVPIEAAGQTANLLVPLYGVIAAGALSRLPALLRGRRPEGTRERPPGALAAVLVAFVVLYAIQAAYSDELSFALQQVVFFYVPFALLFAMLVRLDWSARLVTGCAAVVAGLALLFAAVGYVEYATRTLLFNPDVIASNAFGSYFRVNSLFFDPNIYGRFLAIVMIVIAAGVAWSRERREIALLGVLLALLWGALVLTFSQSSFAALLAGLVVLGALRWSVKAVALPLAVLMAVGGVGAVAALAVRDELPTAREVNRATVGRSNLVTGGLELWTERPAAGWGAGSFQSEYRRAEGLSGRPNAVTASHTTPVTVLAEQGLVGFALYLALVLGALATLLRGARAGPARAALAAAFVALVVHTMVYAAFLEDPATWVLLAAGVALAGQARYEAATAPPSRTRRPRRPETASTP